MINADEPTYPHKNLGPTKSLNVECDNCHRNVTISCLPSRSYPVKNEPLGLTMGKRKRYTNAEKLVLAGKASLPGCSIASVALGEGLPQSTM